MDIKTLKEKRMHRAAKIKAIDVDSRTIDLAFSSEKEFSRVWGIEILKHDADSVDIARLKDGGALLLNHDASQQIGVVEVASIDSDRIGRAKVRFSRSDLADEILNDVKDGIRRHVSVGYQIHEAKTIETRDGVDVWEVTKWEPFEISIVPVPADNSVGVGRSAEQNIEIKKTKEQEKMENETLTNNEQATKKIECGSVEKDGKLEQEQQRTSAIVKLGKEYNQEAMAMDFIAGDKAPGEFQRALLDKLHKANKPIPDQTQSSDIGLSDKEARQFSFHKLIRAMDPSDPSAKAKKDAAFELEVCYAAEQNRGGGSGSGGFIIPSNVLGRDISTTTQGGGSLVADNLMPESFIDLLRNKTTIMRIAYMLGGLVGNVSIPRQTSGTNSSWIGEAAPANKSDPRFDQITLSPKTVAARVQMTRRLLKQSTPDIETLIRRDLAASLAIAIDKAAFHGNGGNQPTGIMNVTGVNAKSFSATLPTYAELVDMETEIASDNADANSMYYVTTPSVRNHAKTTPKFNSAGDSTIWEPGDQINGYNVEVTNQVSANHVFLGNFSDLIVAMWGGLEMIVDPYSESDSAGLKISVFQDVDFQVRHPESFCVGKKEP